MIKGLLDPPIFVAIMYTISVRTTQNVVIQYPVASIGERIGAYLIDRLILAAYAILIIVLFVRIKVDQVWLWIIALFIPFLLFSLLFEIFMNGQTPGKRLLKIQIVRLDGTRASVGDFILRWIFAFVDFMILGGVIAVITIAAGGKGQRLGDLVAGTSAVKLVEQVETSAKDIFIVADDGYVPVFAQAMQLNSTDIELLQRALEAEKHHGNDEPLELLIEKIKLQFGIQTELPSREFVETLIKDHSYFISRVS